MKKIAIIGSGISGLTAAYLLSKKHQVHVFEKAPCIGGHTATVDVDVDNQHFAIDTGFIVFNDRTYPNFLALLDNIGVSKQPTEMSFSVKNIITGLEYNGHDLNTLFAQRRNIFNPRFWLLIKEIIRFNGRCKNLYQALQTQNTHYDSESTLGDFLQEHGFSYYFSQHYILPMAAAIWSSSLQDILEFPLLFFIRFFHNHGLLELTNRPQWYVIPGGSRNYLPALTKPFAERIHLNSQIAKVTRDQEQVQLHFMDNSVQTFDEVVLACHSDQALALLADASVDEKNILSAMPYSENQVVLHRDASVLPKAKQAWASWNYQLDEAMDKAASVTYYMNRLQGIESKHDFCVTLNQTSQIDQDKILKSFIYHHPVYSVDSLNAQQRRDEICGKQHTHFAGAYWYNGFHEDGVKSALDVALRFQCDLQKR